MPTKIALICHVEQLTPRYDEELAPIDQRLFFSLNLSAAYLDTIGASIARDHIEKHLFPWNWGALGLAQIQVGFFDTATGAATFQPLAAKWMEYPLYVGPVPGSPSTPAPNAINVELIKHMAQVEMQTLLDLRIGLKPFQWDPAKVGDEGAAGKEAFHNVLAYFSTFPGGIAHLLGLACCFSISSADFQPFRDARASGTTDGLLYVAPQFPEPFGIPGLHLAPQPLSPGLAPGQSGVPDMATWSFQPDPAIEALTYLLPYLAVDNLASVPVPTPSFDPLGLYDESYFLRKPDFDLHTEGADWTPTLSRKVAECFDLPQRIVDAVRSEQQQILSNTTLIVETDVFKPVRTALVITSRDTAHVGLARGVDGTSVVQTILDRCRTEDIEESAIVAHMKRHLRAALIRYERDMTWKEWKGVLQEQLPELRQSRVLQDAPQSVIPVVTGTASLDDELNEWEKFTSAVAHDDNTTKLVLNQWARATLPFSLPRTLDIPAPPVPLFPTNVNQHWFFSSAYPDADNGPLPIPDLPDSGELNLREGGEWEFRLGGVSFQSTPPLQAGLSLLVKIHHDKSTAALEFGLRSSQEVTGVRWKLIVGANNTLAPSPPSAESPAFDLPMGEIALRLTLRLDATVIPNQWTAAATLLQDTTVTAGQTFLDSGSLLSQAFVVVESDVTGAPAAFFRCLVPCVAPTDVRLSLNPAADFLTRFGSRIASEIVPGISLRERLKSTLVRPRWLSLLPSPQSTVPDGQQLADNCATQIIENLDRRLEQTDPAYRHLRPRMDSDTFTALSGGFLSGLIRSYLAGGVIGVAPPARRDGFARRLVYDSILPDMTTVKEAPVETAHPMIFQLDRVVHSGLSQDLDQKDPLRTFQGALVFTRAADGAGGVNGKWRCLNVASLHAAPRRLNDFELGQVPDLEELKKVLDQPLLNPDLASKPLARAFLNTGLQKGDVLYELAWTEGELLSEETRQLLQLVRSEKATPDERSRATWWLLEDVAPELFRKYLQVHPCAPVPVRFSYREDLRQSFVAFDNHPLIGPSPSQQLAGSFRPEDTAHTNIESALKYQMVSDEPALAPLIADFASWKRFAPLSNGQKYEVLIAAVPHSGALPSPLALRQGNKVSHPCALIFLEDQPPVAGAAIRGGHSRLTTCWQNDAGAQRKEHYLRRRRVGLPWRSSKERKPLSLQEKDQQSLMFAPPARVLPLWHEFPTETLSGTQTQLSFYFDESARRGTLELKPWDSFTEPGSIWEVRVDEIHDTIERAKRGFAVLLEHKEPTKRDYLRRFRVKIQLITDAAGTQKLKFKLRAGLGTEVGFLSHPIPDALRLRYGLRFLLRRAPTPPSPIPTDPKDAPLELAAFYRFGTDDWIEGDKVALFTVPIDSFDNGRLRFSFASEDIDEPAKGALSEEAVIFSTPQLQFPQGLQVPPDQDRPLLLLPHPSLASTRGDAVNVNTAVFHVAFPVTDLTTWDRWVTRDQHTVSMAASNNVRERRINVWVGMHQNGDVEHERQPKVQRALDDPAQGLAVADDLGIRRPFMVAELVQLHSTPSVFAPTNKLVMVMAAQGRDTSLTSVQCHPITVTCKREFGLSTGPVLVSPADGELAVTLPPGGLFELRLYPAIADEFFGNDIKGRFPGGVAEGRPEFEDGGVKYRLFPPLLTAIETATTALPGADQVWDAMRFAQDKNNLTVQLERYGVKADGTLYPADDWQLVRSVRLARQAWRWQGRPLTPFPSHMGLNADLLPARTLGNEDETPENTPLVWDAEGFGTRPESDTVEKQAVIERRNPKPVILEYPLTRDDRAMQLRFALEVESRYAGIANLLLHEVTDLARFPIVRAERPLSSAPGSQMPIRDPWRRHFVPGRWNDAHEVPIPALKFMLPLTQSEVDGLPGTAGILVVLREPWYEVGGLAETLEAQITQVRPANLGAPLQSAGFDPIVSGARQKARLNDPRVDSPIGYTFDTDTEEPLLLSSSFVLRPPTLALRPVDVEAPTTSDESTTPGATLPTKAWTWVLDSNSGVHEIRLTGISLTEPIGQRWRLILDAPAGTTASAPLADIELVVNQRSNGELWLRLQNEPAIVVFKPLKKLDLRVTLTPISRDMPRESQAEPVQWKCQAFSRTSSLSDGQHGNWQPIHRVKSLEEELASFAVETDVIGNVLWTNPENARPIRLSVQGLPSQDPALNGTQAPPFLPELPQPTVRHDAAWRMLQLRLRRRLTRGGQLTQQFDVNAAKPATLSVPDQATEVGLKVTGWDLEQDLKLVIGDKLALDADGALALNASAVTTTIDVKTQFNANGWELIVGEMKHTFSLKPKSLDIQLTMRLVSDGAYATEAVASGKRSWETRAFFQMPGSDWQGGRKATASPLHTTGESINFQVTKPPKPLFPTGQSPSPELCAFRGVLEEGRYSNYGEAKWVQFLPDALRATRRGSTELVDFRQLSLRLAGESATSAEPTESSANFRLRRVGEDMLGGTVGESVGLETWPLYPPVKANKNQGPLAFTRYLVLTQVVSDVRGRANQEKYVGLYQMNAEGIARPLSVAPGATTLKQGKLYLARLMEVQHRMDSLPWCAADLQGTIADSATESCNSRTYYSGLDLNVASSVNDPLFQGEKWEITLMGLCVNPQTPPQNVNFEINSGEVVVLLVQVVYSEGANRGSIKVSQNGTFKTEVFFEGQCPLDLRVVMRAQRQNEAQAITEWQAVVESRGKLREEAPAPGSEQPKHIIEPEPESPWCPVRSNFEPLNLLSGSVKNANVTIRMTPATPVEATVISEKKEACWVRFIPPTLTAEPWDHLFPVETLHSDGEDVKARIVSLSPPLNGADYTLVNLHHKSSIGYLKRLSWPVA